MRSHSAPCSPAMLRGVPTVGRGGSAGVHKKVSKKWTEEEQSRLLSAIDACGGISYVNWAEVAKAVPGRTGKQCREKYKNDLRPDISKAPWTVREEYILARAHAVVGNQWAEIAKLLPGRSENSLKNSWNATLRSKAESKSRSFLWVYGKTVLEQQGVTSLETFHKAVNTFCHLPGAVPLETIAVNEVYFSRLDCKAHNGCSPVKVKVGASQRQPSGRGASSRVRSSRKRSSGWETSESEDMMSEFDDDDDEEQPEEDSQADDESQDRRSSYRTSGPGSMARAQSLDAMSGRGQLPPPTSSIVFPQSANMMMGGLGYACVTIHLQGGRPKGQFGRPPVPPTAHLPPLHTRNLPPLPSHITKVQDAMNLMEPHSVNHSGGPQLVAHLQPLEWQNMSVPTIAAEEWAEDDLALLKDITEVDLIASSNAGLKTGFIKAPAPCSDSMACTAPVSRAPCNPCQPSSLASPMLCGKTALGMLQQMQLPNTPGVLRCNPPFTVEDMQLFGSFGDLGGWMAAGNGAVPTPTGASLQQMMADLGTPTLATMAAQAGVNCFSLNLDAPVIKTEDGSMCIKQEPCAAQPQPSSQSASEAVHTSASVGYHNDRAQQHHQQHHPQQQQPQQPQQPSSAEDLDTPSYEQMLGGSSMPPLLFPSAPPSTQHMMAPLATSGAAPVDYDEDMYCHVTSYIGGNMPAARASAAGAGAPAGSHHSSLSPVSTSTGPSQTCPSSQGDMSQHHHQVYHRSAACPGGLPVHAEMDGYCAALAHCSAERMFDALHEQHAQPPSCANAQRAAATGYGGPYAAGDYGSSAGLTGLMSPGLYNAPATWGLF